MRFNSWTCQNPKQSIFYLKKRRTKTYLLHMPKINSQARLSISIRPSFVHMITIVCGENGCLSVNWQIKCSNTDWLRPQQVWPYTMEPNCLAHMVVSMLNVRLPNVKLPNVRLSNVRLPNVRLPNAWTDSWPGSSGMSNSRGDCIKKRWSLKTTRLGDRIAEW